VARKTGVYSPADWVSLNEAFARIKALTGSTVLAERLLMRELGTRLPSALLIVGRDAEGYEKEIFRLLKLSDWQGPGPLRLFELSGGVGGIRVDGINPELTPFPMLFFVARKRFDELYPAGAVAVVDPPEPRSKPEQKPRLKPELEPKPKLKLKRRRKSVPRAGNRVFTDEQEAQGREFFRKMLRDNPSRKDNKDSAAYELQLEFKLLGSPRTIIRRMIDPVLEEDEFR
jgi:hypothetical protein